MRSDIYALGLVLYELFTGRKAFEAATLAEWRRKHAEEQPTSPSTVTPDFDPVVERVILRCLEKDPRRGRAPSPPSRRRCPAAIRSRPRSPPARRPRPRWSPPPASRRHESRGRLGLLG